MEHSAGEDNERQLASGPVRVRQGVDGAGISLVLDQSSDEDVTDDTTDGVLRVSAAVITLELPMADGSTSVLAWDPAEVDWDSLVA